MPAHACRLRNICLFSLCCKYAMVLFTIDIIGEKVGIKIFSPRTFINKIIIYKHGILVLSTYKVTLKRVRCYKDTVFLGNSVVFELGRCATLETCACTILVHLLEDIVNLWV